MDVAGEDYDAWRNAFRVIQGYEIQSTLMPFALSHADGLAPSIKERFEIAARVTPEEAGRGATFAPRPPAACMRWSSPER